MLKINLLFVIFLIGCKNFNTESKENVSKMEKINENEYFEITQDETTYRIILLNQNSLNEIMKNKEYMVVENPLFSQNSISVLKLPNGKVITLRKGESEFPLYPSEKVLIRQLQQANTSEAKEILENVNPYGRDFPIFVDSLIKNLLKEAKVNFENRSTLEILNDVDIYIGKNRNKSFFDKHYLAFVALIGYLANKEFSSQWVMINPEKTDVWNPCLKLGEKKIFFADYILIDFDDSKTKNPLTRTFKSISSIIKFNSPQP